MGHDFNITPEDIERYNDKKKLLKSPISYRVDDGLEIPDLENNFVPQEIKSNKKTVTEVVDIKKKKRNKSNSLL